MRLILSILVSFVIAGCSTTPIKIEAAKPIPSVHIYNDKYINHEEGNEKVTIIRDQGFTGSGCSHTIFIDNDKAFDIQAGQAIVVSLKPGNHFFRLDLGAGLCPNESYSQSTYLALGGPQTFRISISSNMNIMLTRIN
jgi:hypothetical protein